ncbi:MAG TPA: hypothetical protein VMS17_26285 [Gemmataceae bacterium]|nr:hypothetical protein [Gemmataceae bacterium]
MTQIIVDASLREKLHHLSEPLELCDESGNVLATVTPIPNPSGVRGWEPPPLSEEELQRREQEEDYSTAEVLAYLEKL